MTVISRRTKEIREFLFKWLTQVVTKYPVIIENQHDPRPMGPYVSFDFLTNFQKKGLNDEQRMVNGIQYQVGFREFTVSIKATGSAMDGSKASFVSAVDILGSIQWNMEKPDNHLQFQAAGIGIIDTIDPIDTTALEDNVFVPTATMDVRLSARFSEKLSTAFIETTIVEGSVGETTIGPHTIPTP